MTKKRAVYSTSLEDKDRGYKLSSQAKNAFKSINFDADPYEDVSTVGITEEDINQGIGYGNVEDIDEIRSQDQGGFEQLAKGLGRSLLSIPLKIGSGIGYVAGTQEALLTQDVNKIFDNEISDTFESLEEGLKEAIPLHMSKSYKEGNILSKMATTSYWANDIFDGVAYMASAALTGGTLGGASKAATIGRTIMQTVMEAGAEADGVAKQVEAELRAKGITDEEYIKKKKGEAGLGTFTSNGIALLAPNYLQSKFMFGSPVKNMSKLTDDIIKGTLNPAEIKAWKLKAKEAGKAFASEGAWEENIQTAIQNFNADKALNKDDRDYVTGTLGNWLNNFTTNEGWTSIITGGIIAAPMGIYSASRDIKEERGVIKNAQDIRSNELGKLNSAQKLLNDNIKDIYIPNADGTLLDKDGKPNLNKEKVVGEIFNQLTNKHLLEEGLAATVSGDEVAASYINDIAIARLAYTYLTNRTFKSSEEAINAAKEHLKGVADGVSKSDTDVNNSALSVVPTYETKLDKMRKDWDTYMEKTFEKRDLNKVTKDELSDEVVLKKYAKKLFFLEKVKQASFNELKNKVTSDKALEDLDNLIKDSEEFEAKLLSTKGRKELFKDVTLENGVFVHNEVSSKERELEHLEEVFKKEPSEDNLKSRNKKAFEVKEAKALYGEQHELNRFFDEVKNKKSKLSIKDSHNKKRGLDLLVKGKVDNAIRDYEEGNLSINEVIDIISNNKTEVRQEEVDRVEEAFNKTIEGKEEVINTQLNTIKDRANKMGYLSQGIEELTEEEEIELEEYFRNGQEDVDNATTMKLEGELRELSEGRDKLNELKSTSEERKLRTKYINEATEDDLKITFVEGEMDEVDALLNSYESNKEGFTKEEEVQSSIEELETIEEVYNSRDYNRKSEVLSRVKIQLAHLKEALAAAINNKTNREVKDVKFLKDDNNQKISSLGIASNGTVVDDAVFNIISEEIEEDDIKKLSSEDNNVVSGVINLIMEKLRKRLKKGNKVEEVINKLEVLIGTHSEEISNKLITHNKFINKGLLDAYIANPDKGLMALLSNEFSGRVDKDILADIAHKYISTGDIYKLYEEVLKGTPTNRNRMDTPFLKEVLEMHFKLVNLHNLKAEILSDYNIKVEVKKEAEVKENAVKTGNKISPTNEQLSAIRKFIRFFNTKRDNTSFSTTAYVRGIYGSGKTSLVAKWIIKLLGLSTNEVYATGHTTSSTNNITSSLGLPIAKKLDELKVEDISEGIKLLIVDEVGALNATQLKGLSDLVMEVNKLRGSKVQQLKVLVMGDPSQVNNKVYEVSTLTTIDTPTEGVSVENITLLGTLSIPYRSNISSIGEVADVYQNNPKEVKGISLKSTKSNKEVGNYGVSQVKDYVELIEVLEVNKDREVVTNTGNTTSKRVSRKMLIVGKESDKKKYAGTNVEVLTYIEAQGETVDEVYIDINRGDFKTDADYNTAMYTSVSRGRELVTLVDYKQLTNNKIQPELLDNKERLEKQLNENSNKFDERLEVEGNILNGIKSTIKEVEVKNTEVSNEVTEVLELEVTDDKLEIKENNEENNSVGVISKPVVNKEGVVEILNGDVHTLKNPSYHNTVPGKTEISEVPLVQKGARVIYVQITSDNKYGKEVRVYASNTFNANTYELIGILSEEEYEELNSKGLFNKTQDLVERLIVEEDGHIPGLIAEGELVTSNPLHYEYNKDTSYKSGKGLLGGLITKFQKGYLNNKGVKIVKAFVKIYTGLSLKNSNLKRKKGVPYLEIEVQGKVSTFRQCIRLNPRKLNKNDFGKNGQYKQIKDFYKLVKSLLQYNIQLGTPEFYDILNRYSKNFSLNEEDAVIYNGTALTQEEVVNLLGVNHKKIVPILNKLIPMIYGMSNDQIRISEEDFNKKYNGVEGFTPFVNNEVVNNAYTDGNRVYIFEPGVINKKTKKQLKGSIRIYNVDVNGKLKDVIINEGEANETNHKYLYEKKLRVNKGEVAHQLNQLAHANTYIEDNKFRVKRTIGKHKIYSSKSLVQDGSFKGAIHDIIEYLKTIDFFKADEDGKTLHINQLEDIEDLEQLREELIDKGVDIAPIEAIIKERAINPITVETLGELVDNFNSNGEYKGKFYMLKPLPVMEEEVDLNNFDNNEIEEDLSSNLANITPTTLQVKIGKSTQKSNAEVKQDIPVEEIVEKDTSEEAVNKRLEEARSNRSGRGRRSLGKESKSDLGKKLTLVEVKKLVKKLMPTITEEELRFVDDIFMRVRGINDWGFYKKGVITLLKDAGNSVHENVVRHEIFHKIFNEFITPKDRANIIKTFKLQYKEELKDKSLSTDELEEMIAEKFQEWRVSDVKIEYGVLRRFYNYLLNLLGFSKDYSKDLDKLFTAIEEGKFTNKVSSGTYNHKALIKIKEKFGSIQNFIIAKENVLDAFNKLFNEGKGGFPVSKNEMYNMVKNDFISLLEDTELKLKYLNKKVTEGNNEIKEEIAIVQDELLDYKNIVDNYKDLVEILYPNYNSNTDKFIYTEELDGETEEELVARWREDNSVNISQDATPADEINQEKSITMNIRNLLSNIPIIKDKVIDRWLNPRFAYVKALQLLEGITTWDDKTIENQFNHLKTIYHDSASLAILNKIQDLFTKSLSVSYKSSNGNWVQLPKYIKFIDEDTIIISKDKTVDLKDISGNYDVDNHNEVNTSKVEYIRRIQGKSTLSTKLMVEELIKVYPELTKEVVYTLFDKMRSTNDLRELTTNFTSLKEKDIRYIEVKNKFSKLTFAYKVGKNVALSSSKTSEVIKKVSERFPTKDDRYNFLKKYESLFRNTLSDDREAKKFILFFLKEIGFKYDNLPNFNLGNIADNIHYFITDKQRWGRIGQVVGLRDNDLSTVVEVEDTEEVLYGKDEEVLTQSSEFDTNYYTTMDAIDEYSMNLMRQLGELLTLNNELIRPTSTIGADGRKKYTYSPSSTGVDFLKRLRNIQSDWKSGSTLNMLPDFIKLPFFQKNIFFNGLQKIFNIVEYDGSRTEDFKGEEQEVITYTKEKFTDYIHRVFVGSFLASIQNSGEVSRYTQYTYTISDKPLAIGAEITILTEGNVLKVIEGIITQLSTRDNFKSIQNGSNERLINFDILFNAINTSPDFKGIASVDSKGVKLIAWDKLKLTPNNLKLLSKLCYKELEVISNQLAEKIVLEEVDLGQNLKDNLSLLDKLKLLLPKEEFDTVLKLSKKTDDFKNLRVRETWKEVQTRLGLTKLTEADKRNNPRGYLITKEDILPIVKLFVVNNYLNSHQLNQLLLGDSGFFKSGADIIKRMSGVFSPGLRGLVHPILGMRKKYRSVVINDINDGEKIEDFLIRMTNEETAKKLIGLFGKDYDPNDAQGFMLPERWENIKKGFGEGYNLDTVMKPVHFEVDKEGIPRFVKYSVVVLTDELIYGINKDGTINKDIVRFPKLLALRSNMRSGKIDEAVFKSGVKVGIPYNCEDQNNMLSEGYTPREEAVMTLDNTNFRLQLNPRHENDSLVANPTQLGYFLKILETNIDSAERVYSVMAKLIEGGLNTFKEDLKSEDGLSEVSTNKFKRLITNAFKRGSDERVYEIMEVLNERGVDLPWNFPNIVDKSLIQLSSILAKFTTKIKFPGSKFVLQSDLGIEVIDDKTGEVRPIMFTTKGDKDNKINYSECIIGRGFLPKEQEEELLAIISSNEVAAKFNRDNATEILLKTVSKKPIKSLPEVYVTSDLMGFRIPSSELHSSIALKVVGFHEYAKNRVIAPNKIVSLHGSDYDVDSLFVIRRNYITNDKGGFIPIGYNKVEEGYKIDYNIPVADLVKAYIGKNYTIKSNGKEVVLDKLPIEKATKIIEENYYKNVVVETFLETITSTKNEERMYSPVQMKTIQEDLTNVAKLMGLNSYKDLQKEVDLSNPLDNQRAHSSSHEAKSGVGIFANGIKVLSYMLGTSKEGKTPKLKDTTFTINGRVLEGLVDNKELWSDLDSFLNAAIDNVKEQILPMLNLTSNTIKSFVAMRGVGMSMQEANRFMMQPVITKMITYKRDGIETTKSLLNKIYGKKISDDFTIKNIEVSTELLEEGIKSGITIDSLIGKKELTQEERDFIVMQYKVISMYSDFEAIGDDISKLSKYLGIIRDFPVTADKIEEVVAIREEIFSEGEFSFEIPNFFKSNPHIKAADGVLMYLHNIKNKQYFKHSEAVNKFVEDLLGTIKIKLDKNEFTNKMMLRGEVMKYLISGVKWDEGFDLNTQPPYVYKVDGVKRFMYGSKAFSQNFIKKLEMLRDVPKYENNKFLKSLQIKKSKYSNQQSISFTLGVNIDYELVQELQEEFEALKNIKFTNVYNEDGSFKEFEYSEKNFDITDNSPYSDFQNEFTHFAIINYGLNFGTLNYTQILPPEMYVRFAKRMEHLLRGLTGKGFNLATIENNFIIQSAINYVDKLGNITIKPVPISKTTIDNKEVNQYEGLEEGIYFDLKFETPKAKGEGEDVVNDLPLLIYRQNNTRFNAYIRVSVGSNFTYYQKIGMKATSIGYNLNEEVLKGNYDYKQAFNPKVKHYNISDKNSNFVESYSNVTKVGDVISYSTYDDVTRINKKFGKVTRITKLEEGGNKITFKEVENPVEDVNTIEQIEANRNKYNELLTPTKETIEQQHKQEIADFVTNIFPDTKVKEIVYHGTNRIFDKFKNISRGNGYYFSKEFRAKQYAQQAITSKFTKEDKQKVEELGYYEDVESINELNSIYDKYGKKTIINAILNIKNPKFNLSFQEFDNFKEKDKYDSGIFANEEYVVFEPEQIHILTEKELKQIDEINAKYDAQIEDLNNNINSNNELLILTKKVPTIEANVVVEEGVKNSLGTDVNSFPDVAAQQQQAHCKL